MIVSNRPQSLAVYLLTLVCGYASPAAPPPVKVVSSPAHEAALERVEAALKIVAELQRSEDAAEKELAASLEGLEACEPEDLPEARDRELIARGKLTKARKATSEATTRQHEAQLDAIAAAHDRAETIAKIRGLGSEFLDLMSEARAAESRAMGLALEAERIAAEYLAACSSSEGRLPRLEWLNASFALVIAGILAAQEETTEAQAAELLSVLEGGSAFGSILGSARQEATGLTAREYILKWAEEMDRTFALVIAKEHWTRKAAERKALDEASEVAREKERRRQLGSDADKILALEADARRAYVL